MINKKYKQIFKKLIFSFLNIFKKEYVVSHVHQSPYQKVVIENASLNIAYVQTEYLKYQKVFPYSNKEIKVTGSVNLNYYKDVYVDLDNGIALNDDLKIIQESKKYPSLNVGTYLEKISGCNVIDDECVVVINGALNAQYFHIWFDSLIKLYYLNQINGLKPTIVVWDRVPKIYKDVIYSFDDVFKIITVSERFIKVKEYLIIKNLYWAKHAPYFTIKIRDFFVQKLVTDRQLKTTFPSKIYIARKTRPILNASEIETIFKKNGYHVFYLEDLTIFEQAKLFNTVSVVAGLHGAGFANLIFASDKLKVVELQNYAVIPTYYFISKQLNLEYYYVLPDEFQYDKISNPYSESRAFYEQKLINVSFNPESVEYVLKQIEIP